MNGKEAVIALMQGKVIREDIREISFRWRQNYLEILSLSGWAECVNSDWSLIAITKKNNWSIVPDPSEPKVDSRIIESSLLLQAEPKGLPENLDEHFYGETRHITISNTRAINAILDYLREAQK